MKISKIIEALQQDLEIHGDLRLFIRANVLKTFAIVLKRRKTVITQSAVSVGIVMQIKAR